MLEGSVLAGYLAVGATRATGAVFEVAPNTLLDQLATRIEQRVGRRAVQDVEALPNDVARQLRLGREIDAAARADPAFAGELAWLQPRLDRLVGRQAFMRLRAAPPNQALRSEHDHGARRPNGLMAALRGGVSRARKG